MGKKGETKKLLTVAPFQCAWRKELRFRDAGRGCVAFDAFARNDVTVVFREHAGSRHYNYRMDVTPNYTVVLGSHRNKRLKIEVSGETVVDVAGIGLCSSSAFQSYWISIYDGLISIGEGRCPFQNVVFQWLDSKPTFKVQYIGLGSWDKHVGYRNISVLSLQRECNFMERGMVNSNDMTEIDVEEDNDGEDEESDEEERKGKDELEDRVGLGCFLESWDLSDVIFVVGGSGEKVVPAHGVILNSCGEFIVDSSSSENEKVFRLPNVAYSVLHAMLKFIYTGRISICESELEPLRDLSIDFQVVSLVDRCQEMIDTWKKGDSPKELEIVHFSIRTHSWSIFPPELPIDVKKLQQLLLTGGNSDIDLYVDGYGCVARVHKVILSLWSAPFFKMFTNGMKESSSSAIRLWDVSPEALLGMLRFMYGADLEIKDSSEIDTLLIPLLFMADRFGVNYLPHVCCKNILECLSEDMVCPILQAVSLLPTCSVLQDTCEKYLAMHFDYCTTTNSDFVMLNTATFTRILEHPSLTVTSEERILDAILLWGIQSDKVCGWQAVDELLKCSTPDSVFQERISAIDSLLPLVRFPLMPKPLVRMLEESNLSIKIPVFRQLVEETLGNCNVEMSKKISDDQNVRFQHRPTSFKELRYICDGDDNGVIYYSGTSYGKHQWVNPVIAKKIIVAASSPTSRYTDPKALVSRAYQATSFAGPQIEQGNTCAWWMVDLGQEHQLMCNYYTIRQDGSTAYPRRWFLEGSPDGEKWSKLLVHENDQTLCKPGQFASWPVSGPSALLPFRFFRVVLTGATTALSNPWNFCICFIELYGYFR